MKPVNKPNVAFRPKKLIVPEEVRRFTLTMQGNLPGGGQVITLKAMPQIVFKPERLVVSNPGKAIIHAIRIGDVDMLAGKIPAAMFGTDAIGARFDAPSVSPGQRIELDVSTSEAGGGIFVAALIGSGGGPPAKPDILENAEQALAEEAK